MNKYFITSSFSILILCFAQLTTAGENVEKINIHKPWDGQLQKFVENGLVDYKGWTKERTTLEEYLNSLNTLTVEEINKFSKDEKLALYINAYNAYTVKVILDNPNKKSIRKIKPNAWKQKIVKIAGETFSLNHLEHEIIRKDFNEPRIHFAVVCASISCPPLSNRAFSAENLESQLVNNTRIYLADKRQNNFDSNKNYLSKLFKWYKKDFKKFPGGLSGFLKKYGPKSYDQKKSTKWMDYNWNLNSQPDKI